MKNFQRRLLLIVAVYFLLHLFLRLGISNSLEKDEAEMVLQFQQPFALGYNSQPPLYTWLQMGVFKVFGLNIFSLALVKNFLLFINFSLIFKLAREILNDELFAAMSALSLFLIYDFSWVAQKDLTHSIILITTASLTLYALLRLFSEKSLRRYILLGFCMAFGILAKYNFLIFLSAVILSALCSARFRRVIIDRRFLISLSLAFSVISAHLFWAFSHADRVMVDRQKLNMQEAGILTGLSGVGSLLEKTALFLLPFLFVYLLLFRKKSARRGPLSEEERSKKHFLESFFLFSFIIAVSLIIFLRVSAVQVRWLFPLLFLFPVYFFLRFRHYDLTQRALKVFLALVFICLFFTAGSLYGRILFASSAGKFTRLNYPFDRLAFSIREDGFVNGLIIADNYIVGGGLKLNFKDSFVITPEEKLQFSVPEEFSSVLLVYTDETWPSVRESMVALAGQLGFRISDKAAVSKKALYKYSKDSYYTIYLLKGERQSG